jgi:hypothetical protein
MDGWREGGQRIRVTSKHTSQGKGLISSAEDGETLYHRRGFFDVFFFCFCFSVWFVFSSGFVASALFKGNGQETRELDGYDDVARRVVSCHGTPSRRSLDYGKKKKKIVRRERGKRQNLRLQYARHWSSPAGGPEFGRSGGKQANKMMFCVEARGQAHVGELAGLLPNTPSMAVAKYSRKLHGPAGNMLDRVFSVFF